MGFIGLIVIHDRPFTCMHAVINPCDSSPCANNGSCVPGMGPPRSRVDYTCQCAAGYTGPRCESNIDRCQLAVCPNNSAGSFTTSEASQAGSELRGKRNATSTLLAIIVPLSVILLIIIVITVVLIVVIIKWRGKKTHSKVHRGERN